MKTILIHSLLISVTASQLTNFSINTTAKSSLRVNTASSQNQSNIGHINEEKEYTGLVLVRK